MNFPDKFGDRKPDRSPTLTSREEFELRQFREAGVSIPDCAQYFGISRGAAARVLAKLHL